MVAICKFCKERGPLSKLNTLQLRVASKKSPIRITENDVFCIECRNKINEYLKRNKRRRQESPVGPTPDTNTTTSSVFGSESSSQDTTQSSTNSRSRRNSPPRKVARRTIQHEQVVPQAVSSPDDINRNAGLSQPLSSQSFFIPLSQLTSKDSSESSSQLNVAPIIPNVIVVQEQIGNESDTSTDDEDRIGIPLEVPGSRAISNVQPLIRRSRKRAVFPDDREVPLFNRSNFGG